MQETEKGNVVKRLQCRGAEADQASAPLDSSSERDFLGERLGWYFLATFVASAVFFLAGRFIYDLWPARIPINNSLLQPFLLFHLSSVAVLLVMWLAVRQPSLGQGALPRDGRLRNDRGPRPALRDGRKHAGLVAAREHRDAGRHGGAALSRRRRPEPAVAHGLDLDAGDPAHSVRRLRGAPHDARALGRRRGGQLRALGAARRAAVDDRLVRDVPPAQQRGSRTPPRPVHPEGEDRRRAAWASSTAPSTRCCAVPRRSSCCLPPRPARRACAASSARCSSRRA